MSRTDENVINTFSCQKFFYIFRYTFIVFTPPNLFVEKSELWRCKTVEKNSCNYQWRKKCVFINCRTLHNVFSHLFDSISFILFIFIANNCIFNLFLKVIRKTILKRMQGHGSFIQYVSVRKDFECVNWKLILKIRLDSPSSVPTNWKSNPLEPGWDWHDLIDDTTSNSLWWFCLAFENEPRKSRGQTKAMVEVIDYRWHHYYHSRECLEMKWKKVYFEINSIKFRSSKLCVWLQATKSTKFLAIKLSGQRKGF